MTRYRWVLARKAEGFPVTMACKVADVSRQAFYDWRQRAESGPSDAEQAEAALVDVMRDIADDFDETYGSPRMTVELTNQGWVVNHKRVARLMRVHGIVGVHKPAKVRTTIPAEHNPPLPDLVGRRFDPGMADVAWVSDITYIPTGEGWLYLATVLDLGSRRLLGYSMNTHMRTSLITDALDMAAGVRGGATAGIIFHSDRGSQYMSREFAQAIGDRQMVQSVGRTGVCWDKALVSYCTSWGRFGGLSPVEAAADVFDESGVSGCGRFEKPFVLVVGFVGGEEAGSVPGFDGGGVDVESVGCFGEGEEAAGLEPFGVGGELVGAA